MNSKASFVLIIFAIFIDLTVVPSHAAESHAESYWKAKLGNIPMPKALKNSLLLGSNDGNAKLNHNSMYQPESTTFIGYGENPPHSINQPDNTKFNLYGEGHQQSSTNYLESTNFINYGKHQQRSANHLESTNFINYGKHQERSANNLESTNFISYGGGHQQRSVNHHDSTNFISYGGGHQQSSANHPENTKIVGSSDGPVLFFTNEVLLRAPGAKMRLHFSKIDNKSKFLPLQIAKSMPTSSDKFQVILNLLSVNPKSVEAQDIENTLKECEEDGVTNEVRNCTTSLEAMIDYVTLNLSFAKNKLKVLSTEQDEEILLEYRIQKAEKFGNNDDNNHNLVCHKMNNPYAVFLCHNIKHTDVYGVSLIGANGRKTKAVAVCHMDTSSWNPDYIAFQLLKIKPGSKPICHFLSGNAIVWLPN